MKWYESANKRSLYLNLSGLNHCLLVPVYGIINFVHAQCFFIIQGTFQRVIAYKNMHTLIMYISVIAHPQLSAFYTCRQII